jgi:hypothetical protein
MRRFMIGNAAVLVSLALVAGVARAASLDGLAVDVKNESEPVLCAENDNVTLSMTNPDVRSFRIEATHPVYLSPDLSNGWEADWTACDMAADSVFAGPVPPRTVTLYEEDEMRIVGHTFVKFWRPATATVRIGDRVEAGLHRIEVWVLRPGGITSEQVLENYPQDGYWRARPMAPAKMGSMTYGSSFVVGPIETDGRPIVKIKEVVFDPKTRSFTLNYEKSGSATLKLVTIDQHRLGIDVSFDRSMGARPFAMLRSMYISELNNDVARIAVREKGANRWREDNIMTFGRANATDIWTGRLTPSQHNTTSPGLMFNSFSDGPYPKRPKAEAPH